MVVLLPSVRLPAAFIALADGDRAKFKVEPTVTLFADIGVPLVASNVSVALLTTRSPPDGSPSELFKVRTPPSTLVGPV